MPENCVFWQRGGDDVDRRGNNNENTIKSRLHRPWFKGEEGGDKKALEDKKKKSCRVWPTTYMHF